MCPGRTDWYMMGSHLKWANKSRCDTIGATQYNTVTFSGYGNEPAGNDITDNAIQMENSTDPDTITKYRHARAHTFSVGFTPDAS